MRSGFYKNYLLNENHKNYYLRFICNLVLEIWDFIVLKASDAIGIEFTLTLPRALHVAGYELRVASR
jgi:hypothetical protein